ncbi:MAG: hypothetical protein KDE54_17930, partial [Caldilineaceae bacterium]|nr:hypothetical protein [Caldilineaceae bacterium]
MIVPQPAEFLTHPVNQLRQVYYQAAIIPDVLTDWGYQYTSFFQIPADKIAASLRNEDSKVWPIQPTVAISGVLRVSPDNPRYFEDTAGNLVYLTGSHTWANFQDNGGSDPPPTFDYETYLNFLAAHNHNFFRLWSWEESRWTTETSDDEYWFNPSPPYKRTGPALALDGKPQFDLDQFEQAYFDRLRT